MELEEVVRNTAGSTHFTHRLSLHKPHAVLLFQEIIKKHAFKFSFRDLLQT